MNSINHDYMLLHRERSTINYSDMVLLKLCTVSMKSFQRNGLRTQNNSSILNFFAKINLVSIDIFVANIVK